VDIAEQRLAAAVKAVAAEDRLELNEHPTPDQLIGYQERSLEPTEQALLKNHLALCPGCAAIVLDLEAFPHIESRNVVPLHLDPEPPEQLERALEALRKEGAITQVGEQVPPPPARWQIPAALAAGLMAIVAGAAFWFGTQQSPNAIPTAPPVAIASARIQVIPVSPFTEAVARGAQELSPTRVESYAEALLFVLAVAEETAQRTARIEVLDADARLLWSAERAVRHRDGTYTVQLPRALLSEGEIEVRLFPLEDSIEPFASYQIRLESPSGT